ncbi:2-keto-3-deoxy-L-rhamnonate aldolase [Spatholobus suberectus]|nr:2-keto-3-deoxy-L-rhamnonate aldolase [Spatholobus suberectus]
MGSTTTGTTIGAPPTRRISITPFSSLLPRPHSLATLSNPKFHPFPLSTSSKPHTPRPIPKSSASASASASPLNLKSRLRNGETLYGLFLLSFSPTLAEIAGLAGYDFVVVDMEHGHGGIRDALPCLHALAASDTAAILRVPETSAAWAKKALDLGPQGLMFPLIDSAQSAQAAVSYCRYPPAGLRGTAHPLVRASKYGIDEGYLGNYLDELLVMCQVESREGAGNAGEIAAVDGVDCVQMGPLDLSASLGCLWDPGSKRVREVMREAERKVLESRNDDAAAGAYLAGFATPYDGPRDMRSRGYRVVSGAVDVGLFRNAAVEDVTGFKMDGEESEEGEEKEGDEKYWSE